MILGFWVLVYVICSALGLILMKDAFNVQTFEGRSLGQFETLLRLLCEGSFISGFFLYVIGFGIWLYILSKHDLSLAFPIASGALYLGLLVGSIVWLHEEVGFVRIVGILLIFGGILLVSKSS